MENEHDKAVEPIVLTEPRSKLIFLLVAMIGFIALGVLLMQGGDFWLGLGAVVFCSAASISLVAQLRSNRVRSLRIDSTGLTYHSPSVRVTFLGKISLDWGLVASKQLPALRSLLRGTIHQELRAQQIACSWI